MRNSIGNEVGRPPGFWLEINEKSVVTGASAVRRVVRGGFGVVSGGR